MNLLTSLSAAILLLSASATLADPSSAEATARPTEPTTRPADAERKAISARLLSQSTTLDRAALPAIRASLTGTFAGEKLDAAMKLDDNELKKSLARLADDMAFVPTDEAPTPKGWPAHTPIDEIELKTYPAHRIAKTMPNDKLPNTGLFFKLFFHIQKNEIAMTAPVEMKLDDPKSQITTQMGFLYASQDIGKPGVDGVVNVEDVPEQLAISIGQRGEVDPDAVAKAYKRIDAWLADNQDRFEAKELRILGYNSPSMPDDRKYYEVQRVVTKK